VLTDRSDRNDPTDAGPPKTEHDIALGQLFIRSDQSWFTVKGPKTFAPISSAL
jgi:hypothetical protein